MRYSRSLLTGGVVAALTLSGCASVDAPDMQSLKSELQSERSQRESLQSDLDTLKSKYEMQSSDVMKKDDRAV